MPSLQVLKGPNEGTIIELDKERSILGRDGNLCNVVISGINSISRKHAEIHRINGKYYIIDCESRNGTFVNNQQIGQRTLLKNDDRIRICEFVAAFIDEESIIDEEEEQEDEGPSTVEATLNHTSNLLLETQPAEKLRLLIEITNNLSRTLELQSLFPQIADHLFNLFKQADRCFIIVAEGDKLMPRVVKTRRNNDEGMARFSKSIVRRTLEEAKAFLSDDASKDNRIQLSQSVVDFRIRSVMCAPLCKADGKAFGVIQLDTQDRGKKFAQEDLKLLCGVANQAAISMENARMLDETVRQERVQRDLQLAKQVQMSFIPRTPPKVEGYEFWGYYEPAREVGGDYYGYIPLNDGRVVCAVGDVAGKGVSASLIMAKLSSDIRFCTLAEPEPCKAIARLNDSLYEFTGPMDRFVTLAAAVIDPKTHVAALLSGGHGSPLLYRSRTGEIVEAMPSSIAGIPLGMLEGVEFDSHEIVLQPGECVILFTDGVNESMSVKGQPFSMQGVESVVKSCGQASPRVIGEKLVEAVKQHASGRDPHDDLTILILGRIS